MADVLDPTAGERVRPQSCTQGNKHLVNQVDMEELIGGGEVLPRDCKVNPIPPIGLDVSCAGDIAGCCCRVQRGREAEGLDDQRWGGGGDCDFFRVGDGGGDGGAGGRNVVGDQVKYKKK